MATIHIEQLNDVYLRVYSEFGVESELTDFFTYEYPGAKYTPKYRARLWDGKIRLYDQIRKTLYVGLLDYIYHFAEARGYDVELANQVAPRDNVPLEDIEQFTTELDLRGRGQPISVRDYQLDAIYTAINNRRNVLVSPTGSGKSLIIYTICRWLLQQKHKILVVVPTTSLVEQMYSDFEDYSSANGWDVSEHCQKLYSGFTKVFDRDIMFTTWQSVYTQPKPWFEQFSAVIGDEAHQFKAKSLTTIMEKMTDTPYKIGTTGSLDDKKINKLVLEGIFGRVYRVTTTSKLQEQGSLSKLKIKAILLKHVEADRKQLCKADYQTEVNHIVTCPTRNTFIRNLALNCTGNTLILFQFVDKHGSVIYDMIKDKAGDRPVYFIHGGVDVDDRENVRKVLSEQDNAIVVASFGTTSTGINIPSIENIIFASPTKSVVRVLQSIGRGLRLNNGKTHCKLFDITDDLHWKSWKNHTLKHGADRYKIYTEEKFPIKLIEVDL
jgi:superfamily II DNA or RNA helicase